MKKTMNLEESPMLKIHKFMFLADKLLDRELHSRFAISFSQFRMLSVIAKSPGISQKKIACIQETTQAAVSRHIDVLEKMAFVALTTNSNNRKEHNLHLTAKGKVLTRKSFIFVEGKAEAMMEIVGQKRMVELGNIFDILVESVRKDYGDSIPPCVK